MAHLHNAMDHEHHLYWREWVNEYDGGAWGHWKCGIYGCDYHVALHPEGKLPPPRKER